MTGENLAGNSPEEAQKIGLAMAIAAKRISDPTEIERNPTAQLQIASDLLNKHDTLEKLQAIYSETYRVGEEEKGENNVFNPTMTAPPIKGNTLNKQEARKKIDELTDSMSRQDLLAVQKYWNLPIGVTGGQKRRLGKGS